MAPAFVVDYCTGQKELNKYTLKNSVEMMGKTQKLSKGYSSGFVSDYRHAVETMAESEGFGSSGRVDNEMTGSEDSCAPKRKCISLNIESCDGFGIPVQVLSLSKMSRSERKELELRLRAELDQVRILQKKIAFRSTSGALSSSGYIRNSGDGQKRPSLENLQKSSELVPGQGKNQVPPGRNGQHFKRGLSGRFESAKHNAPAPSDTNAKLMKQCEGILKSLMSHRFGWVFREPVDAIKLNIPDYFTVIKHPMDFSTIKSKLTSGQYSSPLGFLADVRLTFSNALTYNPPGNNVHAMTEVVSKCFEGKWKAIEKKLRESDSISAPVELDDPREVESGIPSPPTKKRKSASTDHGVKIEPVKQIMTDEEKQNLNKDLVSLIAELPGHIIDFLKLHSFNEGQSEEDEFEVDIDVLSDDILFSLRKLLDDYMQEKNENQAKSVHCEVEVLNESGRSNSSIQPCKGYDAVDEDVDICGNDPPVSSYPPVEIEEDTAYKNSKRSPSSSSSSDSGSSSSDSDSGSSSGSESDGAKPSTPANIAEETVGSVAALDQQTDNHVGPLDGNQSVSELDQIDQNPQSQPVSVEADNQQEGESAPSERQVSPEKLYRAALLRSRFADTILKAREKTLDQGEKGDPEKLRREREELERHQREEKARLQAEAKAAEDARRLAEAEAAAEAKRKRELEREAARQALLQMEKTVEINENSQFLEDLEMLSSAPAPHLPSADETSPDHSLGGISGFKLQGSNPLEQLGLYMKMDDDEEEEGEPNVVTEPTNDVEEGEID